MKDGLKIMTSGCVDDGKSSLLGRLLFETGSVFADQLPDLHSGPTTDSKNKINFSKIFDGLSAEREQGITIDVAYRYFSTDRRHYTVADVPGHFEYTKNMAQAASVSDLALILVSATDGLKEQTLRHTKIAQIFGIKHICLLINKMDLINYDSIAFEKIKNEFIQKTKSWNFNSVTIIPVSAINGDQITTVSAKMDWHNGPTLLDYLENIEIQNTEPSENLILPIQYVTEIEPKEKIYLGSVLAGIIQISTDLYNVRTHEKVNIRDIHANYANQSVSFGIKNSTNIHRGDVLVQNLNSVTYANQFQANLLWIAPATALTDAKYDIKLGFYWDQASIQKINYKFDLLNLSEMSTAQMNCNDIVNVEITTTNPLCLQDFKICKAFFSIAVQFTCGWGL